MEAPKLAGWATLAAPGALLFFSLFFGGGTSQARLFWIGSLAVLAVVVLVAVRGLPRPQGPGLAALAALVALAAWVGLTMTWSVAPDRSWGELNRIAVYAAFAALGLLAATAPRPARTATAGLAVLLGAVLVWALVGKVVPAVFADGARVARLRNPVGYWNSLALLGATAVPLGLWLAATRRHAHAMRAAGVALVYLAFLTVVLTYSRAGILVTAVAALAWLGAVRARLESLAALVLAGGVAAPVAAWAFSRPAITDDLQPYAARVNDGAWFGVILSAGAALVAGLAYLASRREAAVPLGERRRRAYTQRMGAALALVAAAGLAAVLVLRGGAVLDEFRGTPGAQVSQDPARLAELRSSNRWAWWQEAWTLFEDAPAAGKGAGTFEVARRGIRTGDIVATEPHDLPLRFLAETGAIGFVLLLALLAAGGVTAVNAVRRAGAAERDAVAALSLGGGAFAFHALVDIHWDFVAAAAPAFFLLGLLAGLGADRPPRRRPEVTGAAAVAGAALLYSLVATNAASRLVDSAYEAIGAGRSAQAISDGRAARALNPLALDPLLALGDAEAARGREAAALRRYRQAVRLQPENSSAWYALGAYEYFTGRYRAALHDLDRAYGLDPYGPAGRPGGLLDRARAKVEGRE